MTGVFWTLLQVVPIVGFCKLFRVACEIRIEKFQLQARSTRKLLWDIVVAWTSNLKFSARTHERFFVYFLIYFHMLEANKGRFLSRI